MGKKAGESPAEAGKHSFGPHAELVWRIWEHPLFRRSLLLVEELEKDRIFCGHGWEHLIDVARIAYIENLETGTGVPKYLIYSAALLHDIGRHLQYTDGTPHHVAGAELAAQVLADCGFSEEDTSQILDAIRSHRDSGTRFAPGLSGLIYRADKASRCCFACAAEQACDWSPQKKNMRLTI